VFSMIAIRRTNANGIKEALQAEHIIPRAQSEDILHGYSEEDIRRIARERLSETQVCNIIPEIMELN
jgi:hypothetical protein